MAKNINDINIAEFGASLQHFLKKFHVLIFFIVIAAGIGYALVNLGTIVTQASEPDAQTAAEVSNPNFDQATIKQINELSSSATNQPFVLPTNQRINPFE